MVVMSQKNEMIDLLFKLFRISHICYDKRTDNIRRVEFIPVIAAIVDINNIVVRS